MPPPQAPGKRFCSERHQRTAEKRRYRPRHAERAICRGCGAEFERASTGNRLQVYCSLPCQYRTRSADYRARAKAI